MPSFQASNRKENLSEAEGYLSQKTEWLSYIFRSSYWFRRRLWLVLPNPEAGTSEICPPNRKSNSAVKFLDRIFFKAFFKAKFYFICFFDESHFYSVYWICYHIVCFLFWIFWPRGMWDLSSQTGIEPAPPALEGEVLTTGLPGKSLEFLYISPFLLYLHWCSTLAACWSHLGTLT